MGKSSRKRKHKSRSPSQHRSSEMEDLRREVKCLKQEMRRNFYAPPERRYTSEDRFDQEQIGRRYYEDDHYWRERSRKYIKKNIYIWR